MSGGYDRASFIAVITEHPRGLDGKVLRDVVFGDEVTDGWGVALKKKKNKTKLLRRKTSGSLDRWSGRGAAGRAFGGGTGCCALKKRGVARVEHL